MPRVYGRQGVSRWRTTPVSYWATLGAGPGGSAAMTRFAVIRPTRVLPAANIRPIWRRWAGNVGWRLELDGDQVQAVIDATTVTGATVLAVGRWYTVAFVFDMAGAGVTVYLNGAVDGGPTGLGVWGGGAATDTLVGVDVQPAPTLDAQELDLYALLGSDTTALSDAAVLTAHNAIVDALEQGRALTGMFTNQQYLFDGRDAGAQVDASGDRTWIDGIVGAANTLTEVGDTELVFSPARF